MIKTWMDCEDLHKQHEDVCTASGKYPIPWSCKHLRESNECPRGFK